MISNHSPSELSYWAGILDGEGHIGMQTYSKRKRPVVQLAMTDEATVRDFAKLIGATHRPIYAPSIMEKVNSGQWKQQYVCRVECHKAYDVLKIFLPYLRLKKPAALSAMAYYDDRHCIICGNKIPPERNESAVVCSTECSEERARQIAKEWRQTRKTFEPHPTKTCVECGGPMPLSARADAVRCSHKCNMKAFRRAKKEKREA